MYLKKFLFKGPFKPSHEENLMAYEGDVERARNQFLKKRFKNLDFLLKNRFVWMNKYNWLILALLATIFGFIRLYFNWKNKKESN